MSLQNQSTMLPQNMFYSILPGHYICMFIMGGKALIQHRMASATLIGHYVPKIAYQSLDVWFLNGSSISHSAKKQTTHVLFFTKAEYMALTAAIQDSLWLQSLFGCLSISLSLLLHLFTNNAGTITHSKEAVNHMRTKHINLWYYFIHHHIKEKIFLSV
jgi:hypothetical protein